MKNLFRGIPETLPEELTDDLLSRPGVRVERIVSRGHASPEGFWYDQDEDEWVAILSGAARLQIAGDAPFGMGPGRPRRSSRPLPAPRRLDRPGSRHRLAGRLRTPPPTDRQLRRVAG